MEATLRNRIFTSAIFLFVVFLVSCSHTSNNANIVVTDEIPPSITPSQTPSLVPSSTQLLPPTIAIDSVYATNRAISATYIAENLATLSVNYPADATDFVARQTSDASYYATSTAMYGTLAARNAICDYGYGYPFNFFPQRTLFSTGNGESWAVIECVPWENNQSKGYTEVVNHDGSKVFRIPYSFPLPDNSDILVGSAIDPNGKYLYLVPDCAHCAVFPELPSVGPVPFGAGVTLYRLDLSSGNFTSILPFIKHNYYIDISVSPDVQYLAYSDIKNGNEVLIRDLISGSEKIIQLENNYVLIGAFAWSPNRNYLIFVAAINGWENDKAGFSLFRLDLKTTQLHTLVLNDSRKLVPWIFDYPSQPTWIDSNTLSLGSIAETGFTNDWSINIITGQVIPLSTPIPTP